MDDTGFSTLNIGNEPIPSVPTQAQAPDPNGLNLINPDDILSGTQRGSQALGAPNIQTDSANQRIVVNDGNNLRVIFGRTGTGPNDWGLEVSKPGFNVDTATDAELLFNSSQDIFKIVDKFSGNFSVTSTSSQTTALVEIDHNLGYVPLSQASVTLSTYSLGSTGTYPIPFIFFTTVAGNPGFYAGAYVQYLSVGTNSFVFAVGIEATTQTIAGTITVYALQETAN